MQNSLANHGYVVFGGAGGIGAALARRLTGLGAKVMLAGRSQEKLDAVASELNASSFALDACSFADVEACIAKAIEQFGQVNGVANCIGSLLLKPAHLTTEAEWHSILSTNLTTSFAIVRAATKSMSTGSSIVLVSSAAAQIGLANHEAIAASKAGIIGLTKSAAATYASRGIRINCVLPGLVRTPLTKQLTSNEATLKASTAMHALGKIGEPDDVASVIEWLLSPERSWLTGQSIGIDGGLSTIRAR
jgi:3-oxoacyl-[acyl-carrier protein] reductase